MGVVLAVVPAAVLVGSGPAGAATPGAGSHQPGGAAAAAAIGVRYTTSQAGYVTGGGRYFRFVAATVSVAPAAVPAGNASSAEVVLGSASGSPATLRVAAGGGAGSVTYTWPSGTQAHTGTLGGLAPAPGDVLTLSVYYDQQGHDVFTATDASQGSGQSARVDVVPVVYTAAEAAAVVDDATVTPPAADTLLWAFSNCRVTTYTGVRGTLAGPWTTSQVIDTTTGTSSGAVVISAPVLWASGQNFGAWLRARAGDSLASVSCPATSFCMAVGGHPGPGIQGLAEAWDGRRWRTVARPGIATSDVSCRSASFCMASSGQSAAGWNGTAWHVMRVVPTSLSASLYAISCPDTRACIAVGTQDQGGGDSYAAVWNGTTWTDNSPANQCATYPEGPACAELSISCLSVTFCMAAGAQQPAEDDPTGDGQIWNGTGWQETQPPPDFSVSGVSCASPSFCMGTYTGSPADVTIWQGSTWQTQAAPSGMVAISCPAATLCMAVTDGGMAQEWNGTQWLAQPMPQPAGTPAFDAVTCPSATDCIAVGSYQPASGAPLTLAEAWNGTQWRITATPNPT